MKAGRSFRPLCSRPLHSNPQRTNYELLYLHSVRPIAHKPWRLYVRPSTKQRLPFPAPVFACDLPWPGFPNDQNADTFVGGYVRSLKLTATFSSTLKNQYNLNIIL